ncbi:histone deacetylase [Kitasatospora sp. NPDC059571]|uniref:histone deacetylase n=1 Tax=Kitasatospora sp. NPDC059571 TaxID=3346871 RepID=UPI003695FBD1
MTAGRTGPALPPRRPDPVVPVGLPDTGRVWYAAYGSNLLRARFDCYLAGGRPPGAARTYPGCRDPRPPAADTALLLAGSVYFAGDSGVWGGGLAQLDPQAPDESPGRGYLLTVQQVADVAAQEMHRVPGAAPDLDLAAALAPGRHRLGPGRYETVVCCGTLDGRPVLTLTTSVDGADDPLAAPSARYLKVLLAGLGEAHGWPPDRAARHLAARPGAAGRWTAAGILAACAD